MALKGDRLELQHDVSYFLNETADRGIVLVHNTSGSGAALDQGDATLAVPGTANKLGINDNVTGVIAFGLLLNDVVNKDLTKTHLDFYKNEVQVNSKVTVLRKGWVVTDRIPGNISPTAGDQAFLAVSGFATTANPGSSGVAIGRFLSAKDSDGFAKLEINLP